MNNSAGHYHYPGYPHQFTPQQDGKLLLSEQQDGATLTSWGGSTVLESVRADHLQSDLAALDLVTKNGL